MSSRETKKALAEYVNSATDLAEAVKMDIVHDRPVSSDTVLKLNRFIIAANYIKDMVDELNKKVNKYNN
jgi:hypothetical protein